MRNPSESPGGAMTAIGVHLVDGMIDLMGRVDTVYCRVTRRAAQYSDDTTDILLTFENGATGHIFCSVAATPNYRMAVYGTEGFAEVLGHPMQTFRLIPALDGEHRGTGAPQVTETARLQHADRRVGGIRRKHPQPCSVPHAAD